MPDTNKLRIALVEDDQHFGESLVATIGQATDMRMLPWARSLAQGQQLLLGQAADVLLVDLGLPDGSGIELIQQAQQAWPDCAIMVFTIFGDEAHVIQSIEAGAKGYLLKDSPPASVLEEIRSLHAGGSPISPRIARHILMRLHRQDKVVTPPLFVPGPAADILSPRELQVLQHITQGKTHDEIARHMAVSRNTVLSYVRRIYTKFQVSSKIEAIAKARGHGLIEN